MAQSANIKRIVCFANSRKLNGRCIAGKEILEDGKIGGWVRPVSARESEDVSEDERRYEDSSDPCVLDIIDVPVLSPRPKNFQQENWLLDPNRRWTRINRVGEKARPLFTDADEMLWINGHHSNRGWNDRIPFPDASLLDTSLKLIKVESLRVSVSEPYKSTSTHPELRGHFNYNGCDYSLRITDADVESRVNDLDYGNYSVGERFLTISLAEPFEGYSYKLIAAIIKP
ncbi:MAG: hypothetical protein OXD46_01700 [Chloroflexi bacterium]|nr:hypothetical protein [Chloroflexota bacterium]